MEVKLDSLEVWTIISILDWYIQNGEAPSDFLAYVNTIKSKLLKQFRKGDC